MLKKQKKFVVKTSKRYICNKKHGTSKYMHRFKVSVASRMQEVFKSVRRKCG